MKVVFAVKLFVLFISRAAYSRCLVAWYLCYGAYTVCLTFSDRKRNYTISPFPISTFLTSFVVLIELSTHFDGI